MYVKEISMKLESKWEISGLLSHWDDYSTNISTIMDGVT